MESDFVRKNGLQWPPHKLQVATWVLFPLLVVHYFGFLRPLIWLPDSLGIFITILFTVMCVLAVVFGYITCAIDPADDSLLNEDGTHKTNNKNLSNMPTSGSTQGDTTIYCYLCESNVDTQRREKDTQDTYQQDDDQTCVSGQNCVAMPEIEECIDDFNSQPDCRNSDQIFSP